MDPQYYVTSSALGAATIKESDKNFRAAFVAIGLLAGIGILGSLMQK